MTSLGKTSNKTMPPDGGPGTKVDGSPPATRAQTPGWRDPRLWIGVAIVAASVLFGIKVVGAADKTVEVLAVTTDLGEGDQVGVGDVEVRRVHFADAGAEQRYLPAAQAVPAEARLSRDIGAGELLPRAALAEAEDRTVSELPLRVASDGVPPGVHRGSTVDVWVVPPNQTDLKESAKLGALLDEGRLLLDDVVVLDIPSTRESLSPTESRQVVVAVEKAAKRKLGRATGAALSGTVVIVGRG